MKHLLLFATILISITGNAQTWINVGPNFGGYFRDFAFHPTNNHILFAGGDDSAGIWISEDGGQTWRLVSEELPNMSCWHIEFLKSNPDTIYACDLYNRYGVAKSTDGGENWTSSTNGLNTIGARTVSKIAIVNTDTLFISTGLEYDGRTGDGVYKSVDGGQNWIASGLQGLTCPAIIISRTGRLIVATQGQGLQFSDNSGVSWQNHADISSTDTIFQVEVKDSFMVVATKSSGVYVSSNDGLTFDSIGGGAYDISMGNTQPTLTIYSSNLVKAEYNYISQVIPTWTSMNNSAISSNNLLNIGIGATGDTVMIGQLGNSQLFISTDKGDSWTNTTTSPSANNINDIAIDPTNPQHIFASLVVSNSLGFDNECLIETTDGGETWTRKGPKESGLKIKFHPSSKDTLLCGTFTGGLFKSEDGGESWNNVRANTRITEIAYHPTFPNEVLVAEIDDIKPGQQLLKSTDGGNSFDTITPVAVAQLAYIPNSDSIVAAVNTAGTFNGVYVSTNRGDSFGPLALSGTAIKTVAYHQGFIYAGSEDGQLYKINPSNTQKITGGWNLPTELTNIYFLNNDMYVGLNGAEHDRDTLISNHGGVWFSNDNGQNWTNITDGLSCSQLFGNNVMAELNGKLLVGTYGGSFFTLNDSTTGSNIAHTQKSFIQVFPNPFKQNITVTIPEKVTSTDKIQYMIVDVNGRTVQFAEIPYQQQFILDLSKLNNGFYLFRLANNNEIFNQKILKE